jgi:hypothetical protein
MSLDDARLLIYTLFAALPNKALRKLLETPIFLPIPTVMIAILDLVIIRKILHIHSKQICKSHHKIISHLEEERHSSPS